MIAHFSATTGDLCGGHPLEVPCTPRCCDVCVLHRAGRGGARSNTVGFSSGITWYQYLYSQAWAISHYLKLFVCRRLAVRLRALVHIRVWPAFLDLLDCRRRLLRHSSRGAFHDGDGSAFSAHGFFFYSRHRRASYPFVPKSLRSGGCTASRCGRRARGDHCGASSTPRPRGHGQWPAGCRCAAQRDRNRVDRRRDLFRSVWVDGQSHGSRQRLCRIGLRIAIGVVAALSAWIVLFSGRRLIRGAVLIAIAAGMIVASACRSALYVDLERRWEDAVEKPRRTAAPTTTSRQPNFGPIRRGLRKRTACSTSQ